LKMAKSCKNRALQTLLCFFVIFAVLMIPFASFAKAPALAAKTLEGEIVKTLGQTISCKKMEVLVRASREKPGEIKILAVKMEGTALGRMTADYVTVIYEKPVIDMNQLHKAGKFKILSAAKTRVSILISARTIEAYIAGRARQLQIKNYRASIRFSPPYAECFFNVPASAVSPKVLKTLDKVVKGNRLEGYAAIRLAAGANTLSAAPVKVIVNHFVIPDAILKELQSMVHSSDRIPVLAPFQYSINHVAVQNNYIFLTN